MTIDLKSISCPHCHQTGTWTSNNPFRPFCSERCKLIDLGEWADENRRVPGESVDLQKSSEDPSEDSH